ncbi:MAG TPA: sigma-54 dependent transcriptional regulator [Kofleriaceae bacterium]|nr:sigma-54 dependent transcriptional regulator [Kofleriaceae bacterium]
MSRRITDPPILLVEDKDSLRAMLRLTLENQGHVVIEARDQPEAIEALRSGRPGLVLSDLKLNDGDGFGVLRAAKELDPDMPVIVMTAYGSIQDAVSAMKEGALDFLAKPVDPDHLLLLVERALSQRRLAAENILLKEELALRRGAPLIVGEDPKLKQVTIAMHRAAASDATVLIEGESGTGKELFARAVHALSPRADGPFVAINCAAIPETLLETELFGHEKGAFTGATRSRAGAFESAAGGTVFLDELGELPLELQPKLLRALEERTVKRVGGDERIPLDVRVIAASNRNLRQMVNRGTFRADLYYRLNIVRLEVPPLRERRDDIALLATNFWEQLSGSHGAEPPPGLVEHLSQQDWPGNVRELRNSVERAFLMQDTELWKELESPTSSDTAYDFDDSLTFRAAKERATSQWERWYVAELVQRSGGNLSKAARAAHMDRTHLRELLRKYQLDKK